MHLELVSALPLGIEALTAVYGFVSTGLKRHLSCAAAAVTDHFIHLALTATAVLRLTPAGAASRATGRLVLETFFCEERLF